MKDLQNMTLSPSVCVSDVSFYVDRQGRHTDQEWKDWIRLVPTCQTVGEMCVCVELCVRRWRVWVWRRNVCMCRGVCVAVVVVWVWEKAGTVSAWTDTDFQVCNKGRTRVGAVWLCCDARGGRGVWFCSSEPEESLWIFAGRQWVPFIVRSEVYHPRSTTISLFSPRLVLLSQQKLGRLFQSWSYVSISLTHIVIVSFSFYLPEVWDLISDTSFSSQSDQQRGPLLRGPGATMSSILPLPCLDALIEHWGGMSDYFLFWFVWKVNFCVGACVCAAVWGVCVYVCAEGGCCHCSKLCFAGGCKTNVSSTAIGSLLLGLACTFWPLSPLTLKVFWVQVCTQTRIQFYYFDSS